MWAPIYASPLRAATPKSPATPASCQELAAEKDRQQIEEILKSRGSACLLDCMELLLEDVDVFSARKLPFGPTTSIQDGFLYRIEKDVCEWIWLDAYMCIVTGVVPPTARKGFGRERLPETHGREKPS